MTLTCISVAENGSFFAEIGSVLAMTSRNSVQGLSRHYTHKTEIGLKLVSHSTPTPPPQKKNNHSELNKEKIQNKF